MRPKTPVISAVAWKCSAFRTLTTLFVTVVSTAAFAQDTPDYYRANCMNCHTIGGGRLTGPDLKDVTKRKDAEWLIGFMQNPKAVIDSGDAYAAKITEASRGVVMPTLPGMTRYRAEQILKLIEAESKLEKSQFQGIKISNKPFTDADRATGREIFTGYRGLKNGGAACNACHSIYDLPALGGGHLGPDLTKIYERLKGRKSLSAWLMAPATETMQPIFKNRPLEAEEIHALAAYFEDAAQHSEKDASVNRMAFLLLGLGLATSVVFLFDSIWKARFHSVRRPLVDSITETVHRGTPQQDINNDSGVQPASSATHVGTEASIEQGDQ
ncbi:MAG: c-type cytochrome [Fuerstiella sp.]|nr:c-type cytochrome [Fuerstiella sp.]MCP4853267.1 c-type cytochrome [Fuerstiella sp.]